MSLVLVHALRNCTENKQFQNDSLWKFFFYFNQVWNLETQNTINEFEMDQLERTETL